LYISDAEAATNRTWIKKNDIKHVISLHKPPDTLPYGVGTSIIPISDDDGGVDAVPEIAAKISLLLTKNIGVLIHCEFGRSRSVTCVLYFLIKHRDMGLGAALEILKNSGVYTGSVNPSFRSLLFERAKVQKLSKQARELEELPGGNEEEQGRKRYKRVIKKPANKLYPRSAKTVEMNMDEW
jgi:hypothetical protein